jgi:hypothetical protein
MISVWKGDSQDNKYDTHTIDNNVATNEDTPEIIITVRASLEPVPPGEEEVMFISIVDKESWSSTTR